MLKCSKNDDVLFPSPSHQEIEVVLHVINGYMMFTCCTIPTSNICTSSPCLLSQMNSIPAFQQLSSNLYSEEAMPPIEKPLKARGISGLTVRLKYYYAHMVC
jgi:hypothetical protein